MTLMKHGLLLLPLLLFGSPAAWAQCAPGIPCGGNPMGIPPDAPNSPYNTHSGDYNTQPSEDDNSQAEAPSGPGTDTWAAFAINSNGQVAWTFLHQDARSAERDAMSSCRDMGARGCRIIDSFTNVCGAPAADSERNLYMGWGTWYGAAEQSAINDCEQKNPNGECRLVSFGICTGMDFTTQYVEETSRRAQASTPADLEKISAGYRSKH
ncbi:DUF4189 domain-containing protein [Rhizobium sp. P38BS-XIX]|uniref:DUF4189 domain-containing protein n=1 Tax=Rhizobium sp. P38BS-XIX TaxID=2726740 RepID=UPI001456BF7A|nr:DUF4189 domain-containing protein [Rhizobium sp. P38BS-XIX]NLS00428.1 DUF4189 domain-containing protein [Rhizobium sp. P38BS-XIX]